MKTSKLFVETNWKEIADKIGIQYYGKGRVESREDVRNFSQGAAMDLVRYVETNKVKPSRGHTCLNRLAGHRCSSYHWQEEPGFDHSVLWVRDGEPFSITTQPYQIKDEKLSELIKKTDGLGLSVSIKSIYSWHFPGRTLFIEIKRRAV